MISSIIGILSTFGPLLLKIGMLYLDWRGASDNEKKQFAKDVRDLQNNLDASLEAWLQAKGAIDDMQKWQDEQKAKEGKAP